MSTIVDIAAGSARITGRTVRTFVRARDAVEHGSQQVAGS